MGRPQTITDEQIVGFIHDYHAEHQFPPAVRDIASEFGVAPSSVQVRLRELVERGVLARPSNAARALLITPVGMKMVTERL